MMEGICFWIADCRGDIMYKGGTDMKKIISAICAVTLIAATAISGAACTLGGRTSDNSIGELTSKEGKITIWWPGSTVEMKAIRAKDLHFQEFMKRNRVSVSA